MQNTMKKSKQTNTKPKKMYMTKKKKRHHLKGMYKITIHDERRNNPNSRFPYNWWTYFSLQLNTLLLSLATGSASDLLQKSTEWKGVKSNVIGPMGWYVHCAVTDPLHWGSKICSKEFNGHWVLSERRPSNSSPQGILDWVFKRSTDGEGPENWGCWMTGERGMQSSGCGNCLFCWVSFLWAPLDQLMSARSFRPAGVSSFISR